MAQNKVTHLTQISGYPLQKIIEMFAIMALMFLVGIPIVRAQEASQDPFQNTGRTQPAVQPESPSATENTMTQAPDAQTPQNSIDFLLNPMTLSTEPVSVPAEATPPAGETPIAGVEPLPVPIPELKSPEGENSEDVAMLVAEQCSQSGNAAHGTSSCERAYSNGHHATILTQNANEGDELKSQTVIEEFDGDKTLLFRKTIRHRMDYNYLNDQKAKEKEFFDIIYQPAGRKTTRELMVYEYFLDTGKVKSLSWTQYKQIAEEPRAELVYHALLRYGDDGNPDRGLAERWDHGKKADTFMDWTRHSKGFATLDQESWGQWEGWIRSVSLQAYLP